MMGVNMEMNELGLRYECLSEVGRFLVLSGIHKIYGVILGVCCFGKDISKYCIYIYLHLTVHTLTLPTGPFFSLKAL